MKRLRIHRGKNIYSLQHIHHRLNNMGHKQARTDAHLLKNFINFYLVEMMKKCYVPEYPSLHVQV
jgi:predicted DNA-binding protein